MTTEELNLAMPNAACWRKLFDLEIKTVLDKLDALISLEKGIPLLNIFNQAIAANTNFIVTAPTTQQKLKALHAPCIFRIYVALDTAGIFSVQRTQGSQTIAENLNQGVALTANAGYMFDILVDDGEFIDFRTTAAGIILKMSIVEKDDCK